MRKIKKIIVFMSIFMFLFTGALWANSHNKKTQITGSLNMKIETGKVNNIINNSSSSRATINIGAVKKSTINGNVKFDKIKVNNVKNEINSSTNSFAKVDIGVIEKSTVKDMSMNIDVNGVKNNVYGGNNNRAVVDVGVVKNSNITGQSTFDISVKKGIKNSVYGGSNNRAKVVVGGIDDGDDEEDKGNGKINNIAEGYGSNGFPSGLKGNKMPSHEKRNNEIIKSMNKNKSNDARVFHASKNPSNTSNLKSKINDSNALSELNKLVSGNPFGRVFKHLHGLIKRIKNIDHKIIFSKYLLNVHYNDMNRFKIDYSILNKIVDKLIVNNKKYKKYINGREKAFLSVIHHDWKIIFSRIIYDKKNKNDVYYNLLRLNKTYKVVDKLKVSTTYMVKSYAINKKANYINSRIRMIEIDANNILFSKYLLDKLEGIMKNNGNKNKKINKIIIQKAINDIKSFQYAVMDLKSGTPLGTAFSVGEDINEALKVYNKTGNLKLAIEKMLVGIAPEATGYASSVAYIALLKKIKKVSKLSRAGLAAGAAVGLITSAAIDYKIYTYEIEMARLMSYVSNINSEKFKKIKNSILGGLFKKEILKSSKKGANGSLTKNDLLFYYKEYNKFSRVRVPMRKVLNLPSLK